MVHGTDAARAATRITSLDDPRLQDYRAVADPAALVRMGLFVAEGRWVVERLLARDRFATRSVLVTPTALAAMVQALSPAVRSGVPIYVVEPGVLHELVGFNMHRGCLALAERPRPQPLGADVLQGARQVVVLEGVNNPDNVGGIFRSAAAFDADLVVLGPAAGDPLYRKAIRTSMAATLDVAHAPAGMWPGALDILRAHSFRVLAFTPGATATPLEEVPAAERVALLFGSEAAGLTAAALERADARVRIRASDRVDSLNVAVAASIAMHRLFSKAGMS
jgi:tRNA G18 (ribose-2'-O)-methylase SpoU